MVSTVKALPVVSGDVTYRKCVYGVSCNRVPRSLSVADLPLASSNDAMPVVVYIWSVGICGEM